MKRGENLNPKRMMLEVRDHLIHSIDQNGDMRVSPTAIDRLANRILKEAKSRQVVCFLAADDFLEMSVSASAMAGNNSQVTVRSCFQHADHMEVVAALQGGVGLRYKLEGLLGDEYGTTVRLVTKVVQPRRTEIEGYSPDEVRRRLNGGAVVLYVAAPTEVNSLKEDFTASIADELRCGSIVRYVNRASITDRLFGGISRLFGGR